MSDGLRPFGRWLEKVMGPGDESKRYGHGWRWLDRAEKVVCVVFSILVFLVYLGLFLLLTGCATSYELERMKARLDHCEASSHSFMFRLQCTKDPLSDECLYYYGRKVD